MSDEKQYAPWAARECERCGQTHHPKEDCLPAFDEGGNLDLFEALEEVFGPGQDMGGGIFIFTRPKGH